MKKIILFITLYLAITINLKAQNSLFLNVESGLSTLYFTMPKDIGQFLPEGTYLNGRLYWDGNINIPKTLGIRYETKPIDLLNNNYFIVVEGNLAHRRYNKKMDLLMFSSSVFFPKKIDNKKLNTYYGLRYSYILTNFGERNFLLDLYKNVLGGVILFEYNVTTKFKLGLNSYLDISRLATRDNLGVVKNRTFEILFRLSYKIR